MLIFVEILQIKERSDIIKTRMRENLFRGKRADNEERAGIVKEAEV